MTNSCLFFAHWIGLKRLDTGAFVKDYEGPDKEITQAVQLAVSNVSFEDERYIVRVFQTNENRG